MVFPDVMSFSSGYDTGLPSIIIIIKLISKHASHISKLIYVYENPDKNFVARAYSFVEIISFCYFY